MSESIDTLVFVNNRAQAEKMAVRGLDGKVHIVPATPEKMAQTEFVMLREGVIAFEGTAPELRRTSDPYLQLFLS